MISVLGKKAQNRKKGGREIPEDMQNEKLLKKTVFLLMISGLFILFSNIIIRFFGVPRNSILVELLFGATSGIFYVRVPFFYRFGILRNELTIYGFALIDFVCAYYIYKGKRIFRWIAFIRSLYTSVNGLLIIIFYFYILTGYIFYIYYGAIVTLLVLSRKASIPNIPKEDIA